MLFSDKIFIMKNNEEMTDFYRKVGTRIRQLRVSKGITQEELAATAELSPMTIHSIEASKSKTSAYNLFRIAESLNVSVLDLLYDDFDKTDKRLRECFLKGASLDNTKKKVICTTIETLIKALEDME